MSTLPPSRPPPAQTRGFLGAIFADASPLDLRFVGRTLLHALLVGVAGGFVAAGFFAALEYIERLLLGGLAGYSVLRARGEMVLPSHVGEVFRPWLLVLLPAAGALVSGALTTWFAPEAQGGGGNAMIKAFHQQAGIIPRRVVWVKALASICTLGTGGAGGREGPTMQIGGALGSLVAQALRVSARERRILMIAGVAAGISAIFRTPLGAALLAVEVLYRDDFESDALIPALLASVVSYSVFISFFGESTLFAHAERYPFVPAHLPLYALLAVFVALLAWAFSAALHGTQRLTLRLPGPAWMRPAFGGLGLGLFCTGILLVAGPWLQSRGQGLGLMGGGYGASQVAIIGAPWLPTGWSGVQVLLLLCAAKIVATSLTVGTGGSAGDFAPSLALGGLFGGAFGRAAQLLLDDPRIDPGAFALVGMGTFYGGIAHVPVGSLVMVCELTGSYDLLVPLMLAEGIAFVVLRRRSLYAAQVPSRRDSPAHPAHRLDVMKTLTVGDVMSADRGYTSFAPNAPATELLRAQSDMAWQDVFPVIGADGSLVGMISAQTLRILAVERELQPFTVAADTMLPPVTVRPDDSIRKATQLMLEHELREVLVIDDAGHVLALLDEADIGKAYLETTARWESASTTPPAEWRG